MKAEPAVGCGSSFRSTTSPSETVRRMWENVGLLLALILLLVLFGIVGGVAISKFLFLILVVAAAIALIGFFTRTA